MAKKTAKSERKNPTARGKTPGGVEAIRHQTDKRANIPTRQTSSFVGEVRERVARYERNLALDPQLVWRGKDDADSAADTDLAVAATPLYIQEKISPLAIVDNVRREAAGDAEPPVDLFGERFNGLPKDFAERVDFYKHEGNWQNRMILGDSMLAMNSLLQKEGMAGKAQMFYIDPPYGIKFNSNWQVSTRKRDVKDNTKGAAREPEVIRAFRDTWEYGIHSYLAYLRDRLVLARELLADSGSCFVQISEKNVHLVRCLMDEVFGADNFISQITYKVTSGTSQKQGLRRISDYILWYAKNEEEMKFRRLYLDKKIGEDTTFTSVELADGTRRPMTKEEKQDPRLLPQNSKPFCTLPLHSQGSGDNEPRMFEGQKWSIPDNRHWAHSKEGFERLVKAGRIKADKTALRALYYFSDTSISELTTTWMDTGPETDKNYVVQTSPRVIQRCMLMATDPGDLVIDPTCGSGTTAFVAEQWGRRWITTDTSRVALALARTRLMAAQYPAYLLADTAEGRKKETEISGIKQADKTPLQGNIRLGFVYQRVPLVSLESIANNKPPETETLYDRPFENKKRTRVCGDFTVESLSPHRRLPADADHDGEVSPLESESRDKFIAQMLEQLRVSGIKGQDKSQRIKFTRLEMREGGVFISADGEYADRKGESRKAAVAFAPEFGAISEEFVAEAAKEAKRGVGCDILYICGFAAEAGANERAKQIGNLAVQFVQLNAELHMNLKKSESANLFTIFGEPDIAIRKREKNKTRIWENSAWRAEKPAEKGAPLKDGEAQVILRGVDVFDPDSGEVRSDNPEDIACWFIDAAYDEESFFVRHAYFTGEGKPYDDLKDTLKTEVDIAAWDALYSTESKPFPVPKPRKIGGVSKPPKIAVKVINHFGDEVLCVREV